MIEITVLNYLETKLRDVHCYLEEPENPGETYCVIRKTGSDEVNRIHEATFAVLSYAPSLYEAIALNGRVVSAMVEMCPADGVFCAKLNTDYEYTNMQTKQYRYQAIFQVYY